MAKSNLEAQDQWGQTAIDWAIMGDYSDIERILIGLDLQYTNDKKHDLTYLHLAAAQDNVKLIQRLLEKGANKESLNIFKETSLHRAAANDSLAAFKYLVEQGADIEARDAKRQTPFHIAALYDAIEIV